jgi:hypothetical protein
MKAHAMRSLSASTVVVLLSTCLGVVPVRAEIGADGIAPSSAPSAIISVGITDDPTPWNGLWHQYSPSGLSRAVLNPQGEANGDGAPSILVDVNTGLVLVAWSRNSATGFDVVVSRFLNGSWTTPQVVAGDPAVNENDPALVLGPDGSVHMFYWVDGTTPQVIYRQAASDFSSWSAPVLVSQPGQAACRPAGGFHNGVLKVAYEVHEFGYGNSPRQVVLARQDAAAFTPEIVAMTNNLGDVRPEVHSHLGRFWIDWIDAESGGSGEVAWTRLDAQGHWEPLHYELFANQEQRDYFVRGGVRMKAIQ